MIKQHLTLIVLPLVLLGLTACAGIADVPRQRLTPTPKVEQQELVLAPKSALPEFAQKSEPRVQEAYRFAVANPEILEVIPCYCGCGSMGHRHTLDCYIKESQPGGTIEFDNHAAGCMICVDITQDTMRLLRQGEELKAIRTYIDTTYSHFAAPTDTKPVISEQ